MKILTENYNILSKTVLTNIYGHISKLYVFTNTNKVMLWKFLTN